MLLRRYRSAVYRPGDDETAFLQEEVRRLKAANRVMRQFIKRQRLRPSFLTLYYNQYWLHDAVDGQTPDDVYYNRKAQKPDKTSKLIRAQIEEITMGYGHLKAYRLKKAE
jgi:hypothetical protein